MLDMAAKSFEQQNSGVVRLLMKIGYILPYRYNTYAAHYKEKECMRLSLEPLLYKYGVDIVFAG